MAPVQAEPNACLYRLSGIISSIGYILSSIISSTGLLSHVGMERSAGLPESGSQSILLAVSTNLQNEPGELQSSQHIETTEDLSPLTT